MPNWKTIREESLLLPLAALLLLTCLLVSPQGDFPLNDDWIFAGAVEDILETGIYVGHPAADPLFLVQAYWGALFCKIFGFSFTVLRCSTLITLLIAAWAAAKSARTVGCTQNQSLLLGCLIIANPIALNLSYTFMTDIPFMALANLSTYAFIRAIQSQKARYILIASTLAALAYLVRQFGLLLPIAFLATAILLRIRRRATYTPKQAIALIIPWLAIALIIQLLPESARGLSPEFDLNRMGSSLFGRLNNAIRHLFVQLNYLALFLLPAVLLITPKFIRESIPKTKKAAILTIALITWITCQLITPRLLHMPYLSNMLYDLGIGPITLRGIIIDGEFQPPLQIGAVWWLITALGIAGSFILLNTTIRHGLLPALTRKSEDDYVSGETNLFLFLLSGAFVTVLFFPGLAILYDRYTLMALTPLGILLLSSMKSEVSFPLKQTAWATSIALYLFSIIALQDYMAWNQARWTAADLIQSQYKVGPADIDGGYEINGWYNSPTYLDGKAPNAPINYGPKGGWVIRDTYAISLNPRQNFQTIDQVSYYSWLGFQDRQILILKRTTEDTMY